MRSTVRLIPIIHYQYGTSTAPLLHRVLCGFISRAKVFLGGYSIATIIIHTHTHCRSLIIMPPEFRRHNFFSDTEHPLLMMKHGSTVSLWPLRCMGQVQGNATSSSSDGFRQRPFERTRRLLFSFISYLPPCAPRLSVPFSPHGTPFFSIPPAMRE
jgi:hypothetical protein